MTASLSVRELRSADEVVASYVLRREEYDDLGYLSPGEGASGEVEIDEFDPRSTPLGAFGEGGRLVGTLRLVGPEAPTPVWAALADLRRDLVAGRALAPGPGIGLPSAVSQDVVDLVARFNAGDLPVRELSRLIVRRGHRGLGVSRRLVELGIATAASSSPVVLIGGCLAEHVPMYARYGYRVLPGSSEVWFGSVRRSGFVVICRTNEIQGATRLHVERLIEARRSQDPTGRRQG